MLLFSFSTPTSIFYFLLSTSYRLLISLQFPPLCFSYILTFFVLLSLYLFLSLLLSLSLSFLLSLSLFFMVSLSLYLSPALSHYLSLSLSLSRPFLTLSLFFFILSRSLYSLSSLSYLHRDSDSNKGDDEFEVKDGGEDSGTDDEQEKKKRVPEWARGALLKTALEKVIKVKNCGSHLFFFFFISTLLWPW